MDRRIIRNEPGKSKNHPAASCHDADGGKCKADKRQPGSDMSLQFSQSLSVKQTYINRQIAPARFWVEWMRICKRGADELITVSISPATNSRTMRKMVPVTMPIPTQDIMILGPSLRGLGISTLSVDGQY